MPFYYLPDMDYGAARHHLRALLRRAGGDHHRPVAPGAHDRGARCVPVITRMLPAGRLRRRLRPPGRTIPGESIEADTRRMNAFIEDRVREMPEQYYWVHKRFKTRPPGEKKPY